LKEETSAIKEGCSTITGLCSGDILLVFLNGSREGERGRVAGDGRASEGVCITVRERACEVKESLSHASNH